MPRRLVLLLIIPLLLTGCGSKAPDQEKVDGLSTPSAQNIEVDNEKQSKELEAIANGKKSDMVIVPALFLDLGQDELPASANASTELMFVVTVRSLDAGTLSYEGVEGASIKVNALSYGSIAYKFPKAGDFKLIFTTDAGQASTLAIITAI